jgi:hypothetical protein
MNDCICMKAIECLHPGHLSPSSIQYTFEEQTLSITVIVHSQCKYYVDIFKQICLLGLSDVYV